MANTDTYTGKLNVEVAKMDKTTFLSMITGMIDTSKITSPNPPASWGWWRYGDEKIVWGKSDWGCAIGIPCLGKTHSHSLGTCTDGPNPPTSTSCILFCEQVSHAGMPTQVETICNAALAALPYGIPCTCTPWINAECTAVGKRQQTRTCTPASCDTESRIIDDASCNPSGDITKVTLDDRLLPESGTLPWLLNDDAHVKVFFKNTGNVASAFHIWITDETGTTITGCDITTAEIPADGAEYFVDLCVFVPDVIKVKTLTAHIDP